MLSGYKGFALVIAEVKARYCPGDLNWLNLLRSSVGARLAGACAGACLTGGFAFDAFVLVLSGLASARAFR